MTQNHRGDEPCRDSDIQPVANVLFEEIFMLWCSMPDTFANIQFDSIKSTRK